MPHKPDIPCAGCGKLLWSGRGSRPAGERLCLICRRTDPQHREELRLKTNARRRRNYASQVTRSGRGCKGCGGATTGIKRFCDQCTAGKQRAHWQRKNAVRRGASPLGPTISVADLGRRDRWRCHLCRRKVDSSLPYQHRMAGTRDHLVPVSDGGDDSPANLRLAHRSCNSSRGRRGTVQLALVG